MNKILTIIVPAYNVENFISKTLSSFISDKNTMKDLEVIVVDDGSTDSTLKIAQLFQKSYPRTFKVISKTNGGHGSALNVGIKNAAGKYIRPIDGDDWVDTNSLVKLIKSLRTENADMVLCHYAKFNDKNKDVKLIKLQHVYSLGQIERGDAYKIEKRKQIFVYGKTYKLSKFPMFGEFYLYHNIIYKTNIFRLRNILFTEKCFYDDMEYDLYPLRYVSSVVAFDLCLYVYRVGRTEQSISNQSFAKNRLQRAEIVNKICKFYERHKPFFPPNVRNQLLYEIPWKVKRQYDIYFSLPTKKVYIDELKVFDKNIKNSSREIYARTYTRKIKIIRKSHFKLYWVAKFISKHLAPIYIPIRKKIKKTLKKAAKKVRPKPWQIRSDFSMHIKIMLRRILSLFHLSFLSKQMSELKKFKNIHHGEDCYITCTGPSLTVSDLNLLKNKITFGVNTITEAYSKTDWRPTYYVLVDVFDYGKYLESNEIYGKCFSTKHSFFHYRSNPLTRNGRESFCLVNYGNHLKWRKKKSKVKISKDISVCVYDCFTVTIMALQIAFYMGFKNIYIIGADCDYTKGKIHFSEMPDDKFKVASGRLPKATELSITGYVAAKKYADSHGINIYNVTRGGKLEVFPRKTLEETLEAKI